MFILVCSGGLSTRWPPLAIIVVVCEGHKSTFREFFDDLRVLTFYHIPIYMAAGMHSSCGLLILQNGTRHRSDSHKARAAWGSRCASGLPCLEHASHDARISNHTTQFDLGIRFLRALVVCPTAWSLRILTYIRLYVFCRNVENDIPLFWRPSLACNRSMRWCTLKYGFRIPFLRGP